MRSYGVVAALAGVCIFVTVAKADEFGARFWNRAPAGLGEFTAAAVPSVQNIAAEDQLARELQEIEPAAGDGQEEAKPAVSDADAGASKPLAQ